jgi:hypothetical protein
MVDWDVLIHDDEHGHMETAAWTESWILPILLIAEPQRFIHDAILD